jgi:hypothetical protein
MLVRVFALATKGGVERIIFALQVHLNHGVFNKIREVHRDLISAKMLLVKLL